MSKDVKAKSWCYIPVNKGYRAKIDAEDYDRVMQHTWRVIRKDSGRLKVVTNIMTNKGNRQVSLGQFLMNPPKGKMVYPRRFMDGLDYRKSNLIVCTMKERQRILPKSRHHGSSRFKGVSYIQSLKRWRASIKVNGKSISLGVYESEFEAADAYNRAAREHFGDMAYQNPLRALPKLRRESE
ncbi:MAG: AP2 domain-containing protein [Bdellovibrionales bacterium]